MEWLQWQQRQAPEYTCRLARQTGFRPLRTWPSDPAVLDRTLRMLVETLPPETRVFPGHGPDTTIARERATNPFLAALR